MLVCNIALHGFLQASMQLRICVYNIYIQCHNNIILYITFYAYSVYTYVKLLFKLKSWYIAWIMYVHVYVVEFWYLL